MSKLPKWLDVSRAPKELIDLLAYESELGEELEHYPHDLKHHGLLRDWYTKKISARPAPTCCPRAGDFSLVNEKGEWYALGWHPEGSYGYHDAAPSRYCPLCGSKLPPLVKSGLYPVNDGSDDDYCQVCGERNMNCRCYGPECQFKVKEP